MKFGCSKKDAFRQKDVQSRKSYTLEDSYLYYKNNPKISNKVTKKQYMRIVNDYLDMVLNAIFTEGYHFPVPSTNSIIYLKKIKNKRYSVPDYAHYHKTGEYKPSDPYNIEPVYYVSWSKANITNYKHYRFQITKENKRRLAEIIRQGKVQVISKITLRGT